MFSQMRGFLSRHKRKFVVTGVLVSAGILATRYAQRKLREWQERESHEFLERTRHTQHFESTERTCNQTIFSLAPAVCEAIFKTIDTEQTINEIKNSPENKVALWEKLMKQTFSKVSTVVYAYTILVVTLRIKLNLIGGYVYKSKISNEFIMDSDLQQQYLSLCHYLLGDGIKKLVDTIEHNVALVIQSIPLTKKLTLSDVEQIFWSIQASLSKDNNDPIKNMAKFIIPENIDSDGILKSMINETLDILETEEVTTLTNSCTSRGFATIIDQLADYFMPQTHTDSQIVEVSASTSKSDLNNFINVSKVEIVMAKLIPIINGLVSQPVTQISETANGIVQQLILNENIKTLGANVYETFSN